MNRSNSEQKSASGSVVSNTANTRISGSKLIVARAVWLGLVILSLGFFVISLPVYYAQIQRACVDPVTCNVTFSLTAQGLRALAALGFSASGYAVFVIIFSTIIVAVWSGIGFLIFWRRSDEWFALLAAFFLITFNPTYPGSPAYALVIVYSVLALPAELVNFLGQASLILFLFLFPDGRLVPRWMGLIVLISLIQITASISPPASPFNENNWPVWLDTTISLLSYGAVIFSQIYRYMRISNPAQRKQTKWVVLGLSIVFTGFIAFTLLLLFFQVSSPEFSQPNSIYMLLPDIAFPVLFLFLPISIGIAILRYRLYDIDILINRTLVYGTLTASLALVYVGLVIGLGSLVRLFTGQVSQSPIVIVASTLVIAALFQPLRHRLQRFIDRRFYRSKYDAAKTLEAFSAKLRNEVDLNQLREELVAVVQETMQPAHVSLWLRSQRRTEESHRLNRLEKPSTMEEGF